MSDQAKISTPANGNWNEQKIKLKSKFSVLTDSDLHYDEGKREEMLERIQSKLGKSREELNLIISTI